MSQTFSIPKRRIDAQFVLVGGDSRQVAVFLAEAAPGHLGRERLSDLLNGEAQFIPALDKGADAMTFVRCENLAVARVATEVESDPEDQITIPTEHEVEIQLVHGEKLHGLITYVLPDSHSRLTDYLNSSPMFFPLFEQDRVALVNKRHVAYIRTLSR